MLSLWQGASQHPGLRSLSNSQHNLFFPPLRLGRATQNFSQKCSCRPTLTEHPHDFPTSGVQVCWSWLSADLSYCELPAAAHGTLPHLRPQLQPGEPRAADSTCPVKFPENLRMGVCQIVGQPGVMVRASQGTSQSR